VDQSGWAGQSGRHVPAKHKPWLNDLGESEDARFDIGPARPLADLRHVMCECQGTEGRARRIEGLIEALDGLTHAVPKQTDTEAYHRV
jgi:hypothetical protein